MTNITVYEHPLSPYAQKVKIALREKGVAFEAKMPMGIGSGAELEEFQRINPRQEVPLFVHADGEDDVVIYDSTIILQYIEEVWPSPALLPATAQDRARVRVIEEVMDTHYEAINWGMGELHAFKRAPDALATEMTAKAQTQTSEFYAWLEKELQGDWFNGDGFGYADLCVIPFINGSTRWGIGPDEGSPLGQWQARVNAREAVGETAAEALASAGGLELAAQAIEHGLIKREYRDHRLEWMIKTGGLSVVQEGLEADNIRFTGPFGA